MGKPVRDLNGTVAQTVIERAVNDLLRLRNALGTNSTDVTEEERAAWTTAAVPVFLEIEQRSWESEFRFPGPPSGPMHQGVPA
jgi:hypothetical protein